MPTPARHAAHPDRRAAHRPTGGLPERFKAFIAAADFPCVGAKSAHGRGHLHCLVENDLDTGPEVSTLRALQRFSREYDRKKTLFQSVVVLFRAAPVLGEAAFEARLWEYLQRLHEADSRDYAWDPRVSADPDAPDFSFSIGGRGYYVIGLHPGASRRARRFSHPALVFNLHDQFERLRAQGRYETLRDAIVARDVALDGAPNPMLTRFGRESEAKQYSGRVVDEAWGCPFHAAD